MKLKLATVMIFFGLTATAHAIESESCHPESLSAVFAIHGYYAPANPSLSYPTQIQLERHDLKRVDFYGNWMDRLLRVKRSKLVADKEKNLLEHIPVLQPEEVATHYFTSVPQIEYWHQNKHHHICFDTMISLLCNLPNHGTVLTSSDFSNPQESAVFLTWKDKHKRINNENFIDEVNNLPCAESIINR